MPYPSGEYVLVTVRARKPQIQFAFDLLERQGMHPQFVGDNHGSYYLVRPVFPGDPQAIIYENGKFKYPKAVAHARAREDYSYD